MHDVTIACWVSGTWLTATALPREYFDCTKHARNICFIVFFMYFTSAGPNSRNKISNKIKTEKTIIPHLFYCLLGRMCRRVFSGWYWLKVIRQVKVVDLSLRQLCENVPLSAPGVCYDVKNSAALSSLCWSDRRDLVRAPSDCWHVE